VLFDLLALYPSDEQLFYNVNHNNIIAKACTVLFYSTFTPFLNFKPMLYFFKEHLKENLLLKTSATTVICFSGQGCLT
jgi:hypothetical protein